MAVFENGNVDILFSKNSDLWGSFYYNPLDMVEVVKVNAVKASHFEEQMNFTISKVTSDSAEIALHWEWKRIPFKIAVDTKNIVYAKLLKTEGSYDALSGGTAGGWHQTAAV